MKVGNMPSRNLRNFYASVPMLSNMNLDLDNMGPSDCVCLRWYYTYRFHERPGHKIVHMHTQEALLKNYVDTLREYILDTTRPGEKYSARLEIIRRANSELVYDIPCPIRVMRLAKKHFTWING